MTTDITAGRTTAGPWSVRVGSRSGARRVFMPDDVREIRDSQGGLIACLYRTNRPGDQDAANARLIAAVPTLYAALQTVAKGLRSGAIQDATLTVPKPGDKSELALVSLSEIVRSALASATSPDAPHAVTSQEHRHE